MYIPSATGCYFNMQSDEIPGVTWVFDVYAGAIPDNNDPPVLGVAGELRLQVNNTTIFTPCQGGVIFRLPRNEEILLL